MKIEPGDLIIAAVCFVHMPLMFIIFARVYAWSISYKENENEREQ